MTTNDDTVWHKVKTKTTKTGHQASCICGWKGTAYPQGKLSMATSEAIEHDTGFRFPNLDGRSDLTSAEQAEVERRTRETLVNIDTLTRLVGDYEVE